MQLSIIWGIFALTFFLLGYYHWKVAGKGISHFQVSERPFAKQGNVKLLGADVDKPLKDFVEDFNIYINDYNKKSKEQNRLQAFGYLIACFTAVFSLVITLLS